MVKNKIEKYLVNEPLTRPAHEGHVLHFTFPSLIYMCNRVVPEARYFLEFGWICEKPETDPDTIEKKNKYDEVILNIGGYCHEPEDLGAEYEYNLGGQILRINSTGALFIPAGVKHKLLRFREFRRPFVQMRIIIGSGEDTAENTSLQNSETDIDIPAHEHNIDYSRYLVRKPAYEVIAGTPVKGRQGPSSMTLMSNNLVPDSNIYIEGGWVWGMPDPNPHIFEHSHNYEEVVVHFGSDYKNSKELGAEIEFYVGEQPLKLNKTSAVYIPQNIKHGPLIWKKYDNPHLEMAIMPGAGTLAEADPGGHQKKLERRNKDG